MKILTIGDMISDTFIKTDEAWLSDEGTHLCVTEYDQPFCCMGGAHLVHRNLKRLAPTADIMLATNEYHISIKTRYLYEGRVVFRSDWYRADKDAEEAQEKLETWLAQRITSFDAVIIADYGKGTVTQRVLNICNGARQLFLDPHPTRIPYENPVSFYIPNALEYDLDRDMECTELIVTNDRHGVWMPRRGIRVPSQNPYPQTVIGAGGAFCAAFAIARLYNIGLENCLYFAQRWVKYAMDNPYICIPTKEQIEELRRETWPSGEEFSSILTEYVPTTDEAGKDTTYATMNPFAESSPGSTQSSNNMTLPSSPDERQPGEDAVASGSG